MKVVMRRKSDGKALTFKNVEEFRATEHGFVVNGAIKSRSKFEVLGLEADEKGLMMVWTSDDDAWGGYRCLVEATRVTEEGRSLLIETASGKTYSRCFEDDYEVEVC